MELKTLRNEIRKLSEIVDGWNTPEEITGIERDLVLGKLRALYDIVRFEAIATAAPAEEPTPVNIDLDVAFPVDPLQVAEPESVPEPVIRQEPEQRPAAASYAGTEERFTAEPFIESEKQSRTDPKEEPSPVPAAEPDRAEAEQAVTRTEQPVDTVPVSRIVSEEDAPATEAPVAQPSAGKTPVAENPTPQPVAPTLFGPEEATVRHRHKQRVIMSLYGAEPQQHISETTHAGQSSAGPSVQAERAEVRSSDHGAVTAALCVEESVVAKPAAEAPHAGKAYPEKPLSDGQAGPAVRTSSGFSAVHGAAEEEKSPFEEIPVVPGAVLGEVINHDVKTLGETIVPRRNAALALGRGEPVTDLRSAIGINDKFLLIRDLFAGDGAAYEAAIEALNEFDNLDDCMIHIAENYAWNPNSDGAKFLMELLERKFS